MCGSVKWHYLNFRFANNDSEIWPLVCNNLQIVRFPSVNVEYTAINLETKPLLTAAALEEVKLKASWESDFSIKQNTS